MSIELTPTANLRWIKHADETGDIRTFLQQQFLAMEQAGTAKERSYYVWMDLESDVLGAAESPEDARARKHLADPKVRVSIRHGRI